MPSGRQYRISYRRDDISKIRTLRTDPRNVIVDLRPASAYNAVRIPGTRNIPYDQFRALLPQIAPQRGTPIYLFCSSGDKSYAACQILERMGYSNVTDFGAISQWRFGFQSV